MRKQGDNEEMCVGTQMAAAGMEKPEAEVRRQLQVELSGWKDRECWRQRGQDFKVGDWTNSVVVGIKHAKGEMASFGGRVRFCGFLEQWPMTNANLKTSGTEFRDIIEGCKRHGKEREVREKELDGEKPHR